MEIYLIRHTQVAVGKEICYGQYNVPLAATFEAELIAYKNKLPTDFDAIYSSPLNRCTQLANGLNFGEIQVQDAIKEMHFGDWENCSWNSIEAAALNNWMQDFVNVRTPNGENLADLYSRVSLFLTQLRNKKHSKVLLVSHAGVIRCVWAFLLRIPLQNIFKIPVAFGEIFVFTLSDANILDAIKQIK